MIEKNNLLKERSKQLKDAELIAEAGKIPMAERILLTEFLYYLIEIERRRLYLDYGTLFKMLIEKFKYSEDQAYRRIQAMRLLKDLPEVEGKIASGELSLSHISMVQSFFKAESKVQKDFSKSKKLEIMNQISGTSVRKAEEITLSFSSAPQIHKKDQIKRVSLEEVEVKFQASKELEEKIEKLKGLLAHKNPNMSLGELVNYLCDEQIEKLTRTSQKRCVKTESKAQVRRSVFQRANHKCEICQSGYALEIDHIKPRALGGTDEKENLRVLCRTCNQRAAIKVFGIGTMDQYLN